VIGTNGAGKSHADQHAVGRDPALGGRVELLGQDVTGWPQPRARAPAWAAATSATPSTRVHGVRELPPGAQARTPEALAVVAGRAALRRQRRRRARRRCGGRPGRPAASASRPAVSHGQKRQLEIAMCLATDPQVLLLDEPLAGMGAEETDRMLALLAELRAGHAILLVEHDMDAVFRIADRITVMVNGASSPATRRMPSAPTRGAGGLPGGH
jgi:branched-chain amino acid transport system ATP-binding protein